MYENLKRNVYEIIRRAFDVSQRKSVLADLRNSNQQLSLESRRVHIIQSALESKQLHRRERNREELIETQKNPRFRSRKIGNENR
jgi:hypothetical protein